MYLRNYNIRNQYFFCMTLKNLIFTTLSIVITNLIMAQDTLRVRENIRKLSSEEMHGRGYAYRGDSLAADYIAQQFMKIGLSPTLQSYQFPCYAMEGAVKATIDGKTLLPWTDFRLDPTSRSANQSFKILRFNPTLFTNDKQFDAFCRKHRKTMNRSVLYADFSSLEKAELQKITLAMQKRIKSKELKPLQGFLIGNSPMPIWSFSMAHEENPFIIAHIKPQFITPTTKQITFSYCNHFINHQTQNVYALLPGTEVPDSIIVIGAHYDHLGQMGDDVIFYGAHDNASGTATVLEMARYFVEHPLRYTLCFVLFSGEEAGLLGSFEFVNHPVINLRKVRFMLNLDLLCGGDDGITVVNFDGKGTETFYNTLINVNQNDSCVTNIKPRKNAANSDHYPFSAKDIPAVFIYTMGGNTGGYHQPDDTNENASLRAYPGIFQLLVKGLQSIR